jgi:hypothetical protein
VFSFCVFFSREKTLPACAHFQLGNMQLSVILVLGVACTFAGAASELAFQDSSSTCTLKKDGDNIISDDCGFQVQKNGVAFDLYDEIKDLKERVSDIEDSLIEMGVTTPCNSGAGPSSVNGVPVYCVAKGAMMVASIHDTTNAMWQGGFNPRTTTGGTANPNVDYTMSFADQKAIIDLHPADLVTEIHLEAGSAAGTSYELVYNGWNWDDNTFNTYTFNGGSCHNPEGTASCTSPSFQHVDTATFYADACCCSANDAWGYYGSCGFSQYGTKVDSSHGNAFAHPINANGNYQNPAVVAVNYKLFYFKFSNFEGRAAAPAASTVCSGGSFPRTENINMNSEAYFGSQFASADLMEVFCAAENKVMVANVQNFEASSIWGGGNDPVNVQYGSTASDYLLPIKHWRALIQAFGTANLITEIKGSDNNRIGGSGDYSLVYNDFQLDASYNYKHNGGSCPDGNCASGPQFQHNDPRTSAAWTGSLYASSACCCSSNDAWGWYGSCGFSQFGSKVDSSHGNTRAHNINANGDYVNPPVTGVDSKQFYLEFTPL